MVYENYRYKFPGMFPVSAQVAGQELHRIYQEHGKLQAADIVDESRPESAPLHPCFEWNDQRAAELYRQRQARKLVECIITVEETAKHEPVEVRAYLHTAGSYQPTEVVKASVDMHQEFVKSAIRDLEAFQRRLDTFVSLRPIEELKTAVKKAESSLKNWR